MPVVKRNNDSLHVVVEKAGRWVLLSSFFGRRTFSNRTAAINAAIDAEDASRKNGSPGAVVIDTDDSAKVASINI